jgi:hypothetical protein
MKLIYYTFVLIVCLCGCEKDPALPAASAPSVAFTSNATSITSTTARSGGNIKSSGNLVILSRGICWSTSGNPTINSNKILDGGGVGTFSSDLINLAPGTLYFVRAFATNDLATAYGNQISFTTLNIPTVSTSSITNITITSALSGGNVTSSGGASVTSRGVCWSINTNPTIALSTKTTNGSGTGVFSSNMTGLITRTTYYVRAYATNSVGTSYGQNISFRTN